MEHRSNPVLDADWPDPDVIRVGTDYWMIASSFHRAPGLPVLRSSNLVDWKHVTNALPSLVPAEHYSLPRRGSGVWAPSLREHAGTFHIVYPDPDHGIFVLDAPHPAGPWSAPRLLLAGRGLIDPCPLWDEDGRAYLVHGWARSRAGVKNRLSLLEVTPDLTAALSASQVVIDGAELTGMLTLEGPKAYRKDGWYWIFAPAGGVADGYQVVFRSRSIEGPYEHRIVLEQDSTPVNGPHQGALVDDSEGRWWFLHFQDRGVFGRVTHVQPVRFDEEGWPHMGESIDEVRGRPVALVPTPGPGSTSTAVQETYCEPTRSDSFTAGGSATVLHPRWHWQANPRPEWARSGEGRLALAFAPSPRGDLRDLGAILTQQLPGQPSTWTATLELPAAPTGAEVGTEIGTERAGLVVLGLSYAWAGLRRTGDRIELVHGTMAEDEVDEVVTVHRLLTEEPGAAVAAVSVQLRLECDRLGRIRLLADGLVLLEGWQATKGHWVGAEVGLFASVDSMVHHGLTERSARFSAVVVEREGREI
ncbi:glycoside hydrolase family 43 protein [Brachybacterium paraconglomeratum]|uniref:glycoside hydrolase family 43 protein n=1 Tax=Brachybacterium paraconglomeratum TaxID=173362 RepID=UPI0031F197D4